MHKTSLDQFTSYFEHRQVRSNRPSGDAGRRMVEEREPEYVWDRGTFPISFYQEQILSNIRARKYKNRIERSRATDLYRITPRRLAEIITAIDVGIIRRIRPHELVDYDGTNSNCTNIIHIKAKNRGLVNFVSNELAKNQNHGYFFRVLEHLERHRNYNSFHCLIRAFQAQKLDLKRLGTLSKYLERIRTYFDMRHVLDDLAEESELFICPMDVYLKDVEDSNRNSDCEIASMRFCRLVEILIKIQNQKYSFRLSHKKEHFILERCYEVALRHPESYEEEPERGGQGQFLLL
jgi:hypothetical protein